ncbi:MAG: tRNA (adenosine(37)-N6)-threonylcarbamoyltransferase complex transferase subunit TsaD, partial [Planctomycetota bacterium]
SNIFLVRDFDDIEMIGRTIDDAVGEAYDKAASILGLGFPGGPKVDKAAREGDEHTHVFPISRLGRESLDFSFSGLKTSLLYTVRGKPKGRGRDATFERSHEDLNEQEINNLCASFQRAAIGAVRFKLERAMEQLKSGELAGGVPKTFLIGGGVSANSRMRSESTEFAERHGLALTLPPMAYCTDNAAMIAGLADRRLMLQEFDELSLSPSPAGAY